MKIQELNGLGTVARTDLTFDKFKVPRFGDTPPDWIVKRAQQNKNSVLIKNNYTPPAPEVNPNKIKTPTTTTEVKTSKKKPLVIAGILAAVATGIYFFSKNGKQSMGGTEDEKKPPKPIKKVGEITL